MTIETGAERLEALGGMVEDVDGAHPAAVEREEVEQQQRQQQDAELDAGAKAWAMIPYSIGGTLAILAPELREVYSQEACYAWGQGAQAVSKKYGWDSPDAMPELALIGSTLGLAVPSYLVIRQRMDDMKAGKATGIWAKLGVWWRARKAAKAAKAGQPGDSVGAPTAEAAGAA